MKNFYFSFIAESNKQIRLQTKTLTNVIISFCWPLISLLATFFTYKSFEINKLLSYGISSNNELIIFLLTGLMGFNFFVSMVQSATVLNLERINGTLEIIFLSPTSRMGFVYGRAFGGIINAGWIFFILFISIVVFQKLISFKLIASMIVILLVFLFSSVIWGGFINSLYLFARDNDFIFSLFNSPMEFFSGCTIPISAFPKIFQTVSLIFPLTYCLNVVREIIVNGDLHLNKSFWIINIILIILTKILLFFSEMKNNKNGDLQLY